MVKFKTGIIGAAGYTGGELIRILINHPNVEISFAHSKSNAGLPITDVHKDLYGDTNLIFTDQLNNDVDLIFLCLNHGESKLIINQIDSSIKIIDLSQDFRIDSNHERPFIYGLPELNRKLIQSAQNIANPGCFATGIQLALLPLAEKKLLSSEITISCTTGSTGAGQSLSKTSHFSYRQNNLSVYKPFVHQHLAEISNSIRKLQPAFNYPISIFPQRGPFTRGILACLSLHISESIDNIKELYRNYYHEHDFVFVSDENIDLKQVVNTNKCLLYLEKNEDRLMIVSIIDNLLKGASGQAVQNMNIVLGLPENTGLKLKASAF